MNRRSYLASAATAISGVALASATASAAGDEYDVIELGRGETVTYRLDDGETFENVLIDQTAEGARYQIKATGSDWTIRNVGWYGTPTDDSGDSRHLMNVSTPSGSTGVVENCYANGKLVPADEDSEPTTCGGFRVRPAHAGTVEMRNNYVEGFGNNASYADSMGEAGDGNGTVIYDSCYHRDNTVSQYRIGGQDSTVKNSIALVDDPSGERGGYPYSGSLNARGVWGRHQTDLRVENSTIYLSPDDSETSQNAEARRDDESGSDVELTLEEVYTNSNPRWNERDDTGSGRANLVLGTIYEGQPTASVLHSGGVPTSAEMAASGGREYVDPFGEGIEGGAEPPNDGTEDDAAEDGTEDDETEGGDGDRYLLSFVTEPDASEAMYEFEANGAVEFTTAPYDSPSGQTIEGGTWTSEDFVEESDGTWRAGGGTGGGYGDAYLVNGPITAIDIQDSDGMWVELDGERMSPDEVVEATAPSDDAGSGDGPSNVIVIDGTASPESVSYAFSVSGSLEPSTYGGASINDSAEIDGNSVEGAVGNGVDAYWFSGNFTDFRLAGNANVDVESGVR